MSREQSQAKMTGTEEELDLKKQAALSFLMKNLDKQLSVEKAQRPKVPERPRFSHQDSSTQPDTSWEQRHTTPIPSLDQDRVAAFKLMVGSSHGSAPSPGLKGSPSADPAPNRPPDPPGAHLKPKQNPPARPSLPKTVPGNVKRLQPSTNDQHRDVKGPSNGRDNPPANRPAQQSKTPPLTRRTEVVRPSLPARPSSSKEGIANGHANQPKTSFGKALSVFQQPQRQQKQTSPASEADQQMGTKPWQQQSNHQPAHVSVPIFVSSGDLQNPALGTRLRSMSLSDSELGTRRLRAKSSSPQRAEGGAEGGRKSFFSFLTKSTTFSQSPPTSRKTTVVGGKKLSKDEDKGRLKPHPRGSTDRLSEDDRSVEETEDFRDVGLRQVPQMESGIFNHERSEWKRQRFSDEYPQLFEYVLFVEIAKQQEELKPIITYRYPKQEDHYMAKQDQLLNDIPQFCFPDLENIRATKKSENFSFVLTDIAGNRKFGYCRRLKSKLSPHPEVFCIISPLGCFEIYDKILDEIEHRRAVSKSAVFTFLQSIYNNPFPAPGRTVTVKVFSPTGKGKALDAEEMSFSRSMFSRLEHVDFGELFMAHNVKRRVKKVIHVFASLLLERRVILTSKKLSCLTGCCLALAALLYPMSWQHVYIPVLPNALVDMVCSPTPFFIGVSSQAVKRIESIEVEDILILDLESSTKIMKIGDEDSILPPSISTFLQDSLESLLASTPESKRSNSIEFNNQVADIFLQVLIYFLARCPSFLERSDEGFTFNRQKYLSTLHDQAEKKFMEVVCSTQIFDCFLEERENAILNGKAINGYFEEKAKEFADGPLDSQQFFHVEKRKKRFTRNKH